MSSNSYPKISVKITVGYVTMSSNSYSKVSIKVTVGYVTMSLTHTLR